MTKFFIAFGNYVHKYTELEDFEDKKVAEEYAYLKAKELSDETIGTYGFEAVSEEEAEEQELTEEEVNQMNNDFIEEHLEYLVEVYEPAKHDMELY